jgi:hypothetical protein
MHGRHAQKLAASQKFHLKCCGAAIILASSNTGRAVIEDVFSRHL